MDTRTNEITDRLGRERIIAVVRTDTTDGIFQAVEALKEAGITCVEITMTVPGAVRVIEHLCTNEPNLLVGAGTVLTREFAENCLAAGARFIVSPVCNPEVIKCAHQFNAPAIPGALTPSEVMTAWGCGADLVKIFPASRMGPRYLQELRGPMPSEIRFVPTGGITADNAAAYLRAGAYAVCVGSWLVDRKAINGGKMDVLKSRAQQLILAVQDL